MKEKLYQDKLPRLLSCVSYLTAVVLFCLFVPEVEIIILSIFGNLVILIEITFTYKNIFYEDHSLSIEYLFFKSRDKTIDLDNIGFVIFDIETYKPVVKEYSVVKRRVNGRITIKTKNKDTWVYEVDVYAKKSLDNIREVLKLNNIPIVEN